VIFMRRAGVWAAHVVGSVMLVSCGAKTAPARPAPAKTSDAIVEGPPDAGLPARPGRFWRSDVVAVLSRGLGEFLTRLQVEPVHAAGGFRGWRIVKLRAGDPMWDGTELRPGDVVVAVNGRPIERPEQAFAAFQSLAIANELRVTYERSGARRDLVYPIDDAPPPR
jgi:S1-C subfamily serine protease